MQGVHKTLIITVTDIAFVPGFYTSVLSIKKLNKKGYFWDNANAMLLKGTEPKSENTRKTWAMGV